MSDWSDTIEAIAADIQANVSGLSGVELHRYDAQDPEQVESDGARHLAVWPHAGGNPETGAEFLNSSRLLEQRCVVMVWESTATESTRGVKDETAAKDFLQLENDVRARLLLKTQSFGGAWLTAWDGTEFGTTAGTVRWFQLVVTSKRNQPFG